MNSLPAATSTAKSCKLLSAVCAHRGHLCKSRVPQKARKAQANRCASPVVRIPPPPAINEGIDTQRSEFATCNIHQSSAAALSTVTTQLSRNTAIIIAGREGVKTKLSSTIQCSKLEGYCPINTFCADDALLGAKTGAVMTVLVTF